MHTQVLRNLSQYNHEHMFVHPATGSEILKSLRLTYPSEINMDEFLQVTKNNPKIYSLWIVCIVITCSFTTELHTLTSTLSHTPTKINK